MSILIPQPRRPQSVTIQFLDWGADQMPPMGGPFQRLNRPGNRFALAITFAKLKPEPDGRILMPALRRAKLEGARFPVPEVGLPIVDYGTPLVNGAAQLGSTLQVKGLPANCPIALGKFFSIIFAGQRYLHHTTADIVANSSGAAALPIFPMLRISPNDGATIELAQPMIEGVLGGNTVDVELAIARSTPAAITITERD